jgi:hypothetical protein
MLIAALCLGCLSMARPGYGQVLRFDINPATHCPQDFTAIKIRGRQVSLMGATLYVHKEDLLALLRSDTFVLSTCLLLFSSPSDYSDTVETLISHSKPATSFAEFPLKTVRLVAPSPVVQTLYGNLLTTRLPVEVTLAPGSPPPAPPGPSQNPPVAKTDQNSCELAEVCYSPEEKSICGTMMCGATRVSVCSNGDQDIKFRVGPVEMSYKVSSH